jgi:hypothetical protein
MKLKAWREEAGAPDELPPEVMSRRRGVPGVSLAGAGELA